MIRMKRWAVVLVLLAIIFFVVIFAGENRQQVQLNPVLLPEAEHSLATWIIVAFGLGGGFGFVACLTLYFSVKAEYLVLQRRFRQMEKAFEKLRSTVGKN